MKTVKKGEDTFVEFSDFNEVREVFEEAIKEIEEEKANVREPSSEAQSPK
jgi:soluble cytochrome b562